VLGQLIRRKIFSCAKNYLVFISTSFYHKSSGTKPANFQSVAYLN
jgi:hypothetical protein